MIDNLVIEFLCQVKFESLKVCVHFAQDIYWTRNIVLKQGQTFINTNFMTHNQYEMFHTEGSFENLKIQIQKSYLMAAKTSSSSPISSLSPQEHSSCPVESSLFISILGRLQSQWWSSCWYSSTPMTIIKWPFLDNLPSTMCALTNSLVITNT